MSTRVSSLLEPRITSEGHSEFMSLKRRFSKSRRAKEGSHRAKLLARLNRFQKLSPSQPASPLFELRFNIVESVGNGNENGKTEPICENVDDVTPVILTNVIFEQQKDHFREEQDAISVISSQCSYEQGDTPVSKTKKFNNGFQVWLNKIFYYKNHGTHNWFGYSRDPQRKGSVHFEQPKAEIAHDLPEDALSCYNQYKTIDFNTCYEQVKFELSSCDDNLRLCIPKFSPLNEMTYEGLQKMKEEFFGLPEFPEENNAGYEISLKSPVLQLPSPTPEVNTNQVDSVLGAVQCSQNSANVLFGLTQSPESARLLEQFHFNMNKVLENESEQEEEDSQVKSLYQKIANGLEKSGYISSPNSVAIEEELEFTSTAVSSTDDNSIRDSALTPTDPTDSSATANSESYRTSIVAKVKSAFRAEPQSSRSSSTSSYSPVSISIPALKNRSFVYEISEEVANGIPIDSVYQDDQRSPVEDENTPFNIRDPACFDTETMPSIRNTEVDTEEEVPSTIKFDRFAKVLLYNGSKSLKKHKDPIDQAKVVQIQEQFKNRGSLELTSASSTESLKIRNIRKNKMGLFRVRSLSASSLHRQRQLEEVVEKEEPMEYEEKSLPKKSILKSRSNRNADVESIRVSYLDDIAVDEFLTFFENHERKRLESEPVLEKYRENQLMSYYSGTDSSATTNDELF